MALKREHILAGIVEQHMQEAEKLGLMKRLRPEQRQASKQAVLNQLVDDEIWLFGYGSLMWNPCINYCDRQPALLHGYHRNYCLQTPVGRGTPEQPGLMLALKRGGSCNGIAYQIDQAIAEHELDVIWNREMISGAYQPRLVMLRTPLGLKRSIAFAINTKHPLYVDNISPEQAAAMIATASGWLGTCAEYLYSTVENLDKLGVSDGPMHALLEQVKAYQRQRT